MWKSLVLLVVVANIIFITPTRATDRECPNENEVFDICPPPCPPQECGVDKTLILCAPPPQPGDRDCQPGCRCIDGYVRDKSGCCIPEDQCPIDCPKNETLDPCVSSCPPRYCGVNIAAISCLAIPPDECKPGCRCSDGYLRNAEGFCILEGDCPTCTKPNEVYDVCRAPCPPRRCDVDDRLIRCATPPQPGDPECDPGCRCADGFARNDHGICIPRDQCPQKCGQHEIFSECPAHACRPLECSQVGFPVPCPVKGPNNHPPRCPGKPACICKIGFVRNSFGQCIPIQNCPSCGGDHNAVSGCGVNCGKHCSDRNKTEPVYCIQVCYDNACDCRDGYLYDDNIGKCVLPKHCTPTCGKNEVFSNCSNGGCGPWTCSDLEFPTGCVKMDSKYCKQGCVCKKDYVRDDSGICIPIRDCPPKCGVNERWLKCPYWLCEPQYCTELGFPIHCPDLPDDPNTPCPGPPGCVCEFNFVRDKNGKCIPKKQCQSCGGDPNAESGCGLNCGRLCSNYNKGPVPCPRICFPNDCDCKKGFVYDENIDKCVRPEDCTPICGVNEVYSKCINGGCQAKNCSQLGKPIPCVKIDPKFCIKGCLCDKGYLRSRNGTCVPKDQCDSPICGENEEYEQCPPSLCTPQKCSELGFPINCPKIPDPSNCPVPPGCVCRHGYVRDHTGKCIPKEKCPSCGGDRNAVSGCGTNCGRLCSDYNKTDVVCLPMCYPNGCDCRKGFVLDENIGKCVRPKDCTPVCGKNEVYDSCANGGCEKRNCSQLGEPDLCIDVIKCIGGCVCQKGFLRTNNGTCVPLNQCPKPPCSKNERFELCPEALCEPQTCTQLGFPIPCPAVASDANCPGQPACICINGFVRNDKGICIPKKQCPSCGGDPNAESGCGINCGRLCSNYNKGPVACPKICRINSCDCKKGFVFDENIKKCVLPEQCTPQCGENEKLDMCPEWSCSPQNCSQLGFPISCPTHAGDAKGPCPGRPACVCIDNYVRDDNGKCIPKNECPSCGGDSNAVSGCGINCGRLCSNYQRKDIVCPLISTCRLNGCDCRKGFVFDTYTNKCVRPKDCTKCTRPHEIYDSCPRTCPPQTCEAIDIAYPCAPPSDYDELCHGACVCENGYYRNHIGECISEEDCLKCTGPNEYFSCGGACDNVCDTLDQQNQTNCPIKNKKCNPKCYCYEGYARDDNNICIPIDQCGVSCHGDPNAVPGCGTNCGRRCSDLNDDGPIICPAICQLHGCDCKQGYVYDDNLNKCVLPKDCTPVCRKNEVFDSCANGGCNRRKCSELVDPIICKDPIKCIGDCVCIKGFLRNEDGVCVPEDQCQPKCNRPHEVFSHCPSKCPPKTCESLERVYICPIEWGEEEPCEPGCVCEDGFYRNKIGECISEKDCRKCMGPHEYFSCGSACDNVCATIHEQNQTNCPIVNAKCNPMCYCEAEYARNASNICIPIDECPDPRCDVNERYVESPSKICEPLSCSELGFEMDCPPVEDPDCEDTPGCICKKGFVRNDCGICIPKSECPSCGGDANATAGCGINCGRHCSDYGKEVSCIQVCYENACDCRDGFVYDDIIEKCVRFEDCTTSDKPIASTVNTTDARARLNKGGIILAGEFLYQLVSSKPNDNVVVSATSVMIPLAQLALFTTGLVLEQLLKLLNLKNKDEIRAIFPELNKSYKEQDNVEFDVVSKYYANEGYPLSQNFIIESKAYFDAEGENIDFSKNVQAANTINAWVDNSTHGKIKDLVNPDMFSADTRLVLVNAIYYLGNWIHQFNPNNTKIKDFHKSNGENVSVEIMYQENTFNYAENDKFQVLEMPYKGHNFSFLIILPRTIDGLSETVEYLRDPEAFANVVDILIPERVQVSMPKFLINSQTDIREMLIKGNTTAMFEPGNSDIKGILAKNKPIFVDTAVQKAFLELDEKGTEAAAATAVVIKTRASLKDTKIYVFQATNSYAFYVLLNKVPLFCGAFVGAK